MTGKLYIVATPIGNLEDITLRAIRILKEVDIILAEDTRVTEKLLAFLKSKFQMSNVKLISYHHHSSEKRKLEILSYLLEGKNIALVSDAGTPGISDPGNELIDFILERSDKQSLSLRDKITIVPIPGPAAISSAISVSGLNLSKFIFLGFFPKKKRKKLIELVHSTKLPVVFYESPYRILKTLDYLEKELGGGCRVFIARELTKLHETLYRGNIREIRERLGKEKIKGEIAVIVEGS